MHDAAKFNLGQLVQLRARHGGDDDDEVGTGVVTGIIFRPDGVAYFVSWAGEGEEIHFDVELEAAREAFKPK